MKNKTIQKIIKVVLYSVILMGGVSYQASASAKIHPLAQRIVDIINKSGQAALCKKGGIFRETVGLTPGKNCDNHDVAEWVVTLCGDEPEFQSSACYGFVGKRLGTKGIVAAPAEVELVIQHKLINPYAVFCKTDRSKLQGLSRTIADRSCENSKVSAPALTSAQKQKLELDVQKSLETVNAIKIWASAKPTSQRGNITMGGTSQRGGIPTIPLDAPAPQDPSQANEFLKAAEALSASLAKLNAEIKSSQEIHLDSKSLNEINAFSTQAGKDTSPQALKKRVNELEAALKE